MSKIAIIGSGFSGISAAAYLSKAGHDVHVLEKNSALGGRARQLRTDNGYVFDMGPSWYWMPDVFERFFSDFNFDVKDLYDLELLDPGFEVIFPNFEAREIPATFEGLSKLFESIEKGSGAKLNQFMIEAEYKYNTGMKNLVYKPGISLAEFADTDLLKGVLRLQVFSSYSKHVRKYFSDPRLIALMEFPVLFLGAKPSDTPALYSLMNYAGLMLGTWYPKGGFGTVINAMVELCKKQGVHFHTDSNVDAFLIHGSKVSGLSVNGENQIFDAVIATSDYHHTESLLPVHLRNYSEKYWEKRTFAPSCLIFYIGVKRRLKSINHHTLFFDQDFAGHASQIYDRPQWPDNPLFYVCCPSQSDNTVAPTGHENLFLLMPLAPGLEDTNELREAYFRVMIDRLQVKLGENFEEDIDYKKSYCVNDFISDYNSFKGNAYGLANTLFQTAIFKPGIRNKKLANLVYAGQLTVPGPGVPPALISGKIAAQLLNDQLSKSYEITV